jgi:hypothetical protein
MKRLFFSAMLAIVAIGGALTSKAGAVYYDAASNPVDCTGTGALCRDINPAQTLWTQPNQQGQSILSSQLDETNKFN